jgi:hypothetical protein
LPGDTLAIFLDGGFAAGPMPEGIGYFDLINAERIDSTATEAISIPPTFQNFDLKINPNVVSENLRFTTYFSAIGPAKFEIFDIVGRLVKTGVHVVSSPGTHSLTIKIVDIPKGIYFLKLQGSEAVVGKFQKL